MWCRPVYCDGTFVLMTTKPSNQLDWSPITLNIVHVLLVKSVSSPAGKSPLGTIHSAARGRQGAGRRQGDARHLAVRESGETELYNTNYILVTMGKVTRFMIAFVMNILVKKLLN